MEKKERFICHPERKKEDSTTLGGAQFVRVPVKPGWHTAGFHIRTFKATWRRSESVEIANSSRSSWRTAKASKKTSCVANLHHCALVCAIPSLAAGNRPVKIQLRGHQNAGIPQRRQPQFLVRLLVARIARHVDKVLQT